MRLKHLFVVFALVVGAGCGGDEESTATADSTTKTTTAAAPDADQAELAALFIDELGGLADDNMTAQPDKVLAAGLAYCQAAREKTETAIKVLQDQLALVIGPPGDEGAEFGAEFIAEDVAKVADRVVCPAAPGDG